MKKFNFYVIVSLLWLVPGTMASPVQWSIADGGNGHYYEAILVPGGLNDGGITWTDADLAASSKEGDWHLATISSAEENAFVYDLVDDPAFWYKKHPDHARGPWLGGYSSTNSSNDWAWVTGEPFTYKNWAPLEPFGNGDRLAFFGYNTSRSPKWNDMPDHYRPNGYVIESEIILPPPVIEVSVDIKPGSFPNSINLRSKKGVTPVAILGNSDFNVTDVDPDTVELEGVAPVKWAIEDLALVPNPAYDPILNPDVPQMIGDGYDDLVFHFSTPELRKDNGGTLDGDSIEAMLTGETIDGTPIEGTDSVRIIKY